MHRGLLLLGTFALAQPAHAWRHLGLAWSELDFPVDYVTSDDGLAPCGEDLDPGQCAAATAAAFDAWSEDTCTAFGGIDVGVRPAPQGGLSLGDGTSQVSFDVDLDPAVLGITSFDVSGIAFSRNGQEYIRIVESDIAIARTGPWATHEQVLAGDCLGQVDLQAVLAHEIGHLAGLGHSCEEGEPCPDPALADATMSWQAEVCDPDRARPQPDDIAGLEALYGPGATFQCGTSGLAAVLGVAPFTLNCALSADSPVDEVLWSFGDGATGEGPAVTHTWEGEGLYTVTATATGFDPVCGTWDATVQRVGYVRACEEPRADFHMEHIYGGTYDVLNDTPINVVGCVTAVRWAIYRGGSIRGEPHEVLENWEFTYEFPEEGEWTVVLNTAGPGGTTAARITLDVKMRAGLNPLGCSHAGGSAAGVALLLALLGLRRRR